MQSTMDQNCKYSKEDMDVHQSWTEYKASALKARADVNEPL